MLVLLYKQAPPDLVAYFDKNATVAWVDEQTRMAAEYVDYVAATLSGTSLAADLQMAIQHGKSEGERLVSNLPDDDRPPHINPYKFLNYGVARTQYDEARRFLEGRIRGELYT